MKLGVCLSLAASMLLPGLSALAHDHWLEAEPFHVAPGGAVILHHHLGPDFSSEMERAWEPPLTSRFEQIGAAGTIDLLAQMPKPGLKPPIVLLRFGAAGTHLIALDRKLASIVLDAPTFDHYLVEEGLEKQRAERKKRGEDQRFGREKYTRYIKTLIQVGDKHDGVASKTIGQTFELVPLANPYAQGKGTRLPIKVLFQGKPLAGARVVALLKEKTGVHKEVLTTGPDGTTEASLHKAGVWMIRSLHMQRCTSACEEHDWESFWASLTFEVK